MKVMWNNELVDRLTVKIDMEDRGYQFGDGLYEVIRAYNGIFFTVDEHIDRLFTGAEKIALTLPFTKKELKSTLLELVRVNEIDTGNVYLQVTRGIAIPRNHLYPGADVPAVFTASTTIVPRDQVQMNQGIKTIITPDTRWLHCDIKSLSLLGNVMAKNQAHDRGADEAILHRDGIVTECSASNVWMVKDGVVSTHPDGNLILPGITKMVLLNAAKKGGIPVKEEAFTVDQLKEADEVFASSTSIEATPIVEIDGRPVGGGKKGPVVEKLQSLFVETVEAECGKIC